MKKKTKIAVCTLFITLILFSVTGNIFAQVNQNYGNLTPVQDDDLDSKVTNSVLANAVGALVYALASLAESIVGGVFEKVTGDPTFPWADRVIFNAVPFLDINFFNPSSGSLFLSNEASGSNVINGNTTTINNATMLARIVRNIYFTMLTLAIGLLSVVVGAMAIKLAISTIASEKAKYKEAITNWLFAIIMIFTVHFAMSFIFFVNEKMVEVASSLVSDELKDKYLSADVPGENVEKIYISDYFFDTEKIKYMLQGFNNLGAISKNGISKDNENDYANVLKYWADSYDTDKHIRDYLLFGDISNTAVGSYANASEKIKESYDDKYEEFRDYFLAFEAFAKENFYIKQGNYYIYKDSHSIAADALNILKDLKSDTGAISKFNKLYGPKLNDDNFIKNTIIPYLERMLEERGIKNSEQGFYFNYVENVPQKDIIATLGAWFKKQAWGTKWIFKYVTFQGAILYAIFVTQSILFFFAYIKRFFYVIILAVLAPLVIIYDFLGKNM